MADHIAESDHEREVDAFVEALHAAFNKKFGVKLDTTYSIILMRRVSHRADEMDFTQEQHDFCAAFEAGWKADAARRLARKGG